MALRPQEQRDHGEPGDALRGSRVLNGFFGKTSQKRCAGTKSRGPCGMAQLDHPTARKPAGPTSRGLPSVFLLKLKGWLGTTAQLKKVPSVTDEREKERDI